MNILVKLFNQIIETEIGIWIGQRCLLHQCTNKEIDQCQQNIETCLSYQFQTKFSARISWKECQKLAEATVSES